MQKEGHDQTARESFTSGQAGDNVYARNHNEGAAWIAAIIVGATRPLSFTYHLAQQRI